MFKQFAVSDNNSAMKVGTDGVLLGAWTPLSPAPSCVIDAGCGSGLIALMMAQRTGENTNITGVEIDEGAFKDAVGNVSESPWSHRINIIHGDILAIEMPQLDSPILIISNPPFFTEALHSPDSDRALARHGNTFGVESLINLSASLMANNEDRLSFIAPSDRDNEIEFLLSLKRLHPIERCSVLSREGRFPMRTMWLAGIGTGCCRRTEIIIRDAWNNLTANYRHITSPFYLDK
ncbi:MAG: methyltransferase [Muribaculaceae bacterium]|nr:methyltransferase [Muribaculaceae bacterium]